MNLKRNLQKKHKNCNDKIEKLEFDKAMLEKQNLTNQSQIEELEQYDRKQ